MKLMKTIQIDILEPTEKKKEEINRVMKDFCHIANETAKRMPSLPKHTIKKSQGQPWNSWYKEFREGLDIQSRCAQEAVQKAREAFVRMKEDEAKRWARYRRMVEKRKRGITKKVPEKPKKISIFKGNVARFHNQSFKFEKHGERIFLNLPLGRKKKDRILLPLKGKNYQYEFLERVMQGELKHGTGELKRYEDGSYKFNLVIRRDDHPFTNKLDFKDEPTVCAIDLGLNNIATLTVQKGRKVLFTKFWSGREAGFMRGRFYKRRKELQKEKMLKDVKESKGKEERWMKYLNHNISNEIVEICRKYDNPIIVFEKLKNIRQTSMERTDLVGKARKRSNRKLSSWSFFQLKNFIIYKAEANRIKHTEVAAAYTSLRCNKCGHIPKTDEEKEKTRPNNGSNFICQKCNYQANADFNASINIGERAVGELYAS